MIQYNEIVLEK